jgi:hypothetical protein
MVWLVIWLATMLNMSQELYEAHRRQPTATLKGNVVTKNGHERWVVLGWVSYDFVQTAALASPDADDKAILPGVLGTDLISGLNGTRDLLFTEEDILRGFCMGSALDPENPHHRESFRSLLLPSERPPHPGSEEAREHLRLQYL